VVLAFWAVADFVLLAFLMYVILAIIKHLLSLSEPKFLATPVALLGYVGSQYIANTIFELETFSLNIAVYANNFLFFIVPVIVLIVGKIRKKL
jgi:hypothetical protein